MVMDNGDVKEFGTHDELMAITNGKYKKLYSLQAKGFEMEDKVVSKEIDGVTVEVMEDVVQDFLEK